MEKIHGYRAEVRVIRAMKYMLLIDLYANPPFADENFVIGSKDLPEQKDRNFLFAWIENELLAVLENENILPEKTTETYGRMHKEVVYMILAKLYINAEVYINQPKYTECLTYLNKIIVSGKYQLDINSYKAIFCADNDISTEIIFPIIFDGQHAQSYGGTTYLIAASLGEQMLPQDFGLGANGWSGLRAKEQLVDLFEPNDLRSEEKVCIWREGKFRETTALNDFKYGYSVVKFTNKTHDGLNGSDLTFSDTDFPFYRLADVYLMYAEAVLRGGQGGDLATAINLVNQVRARSNASAVSNANLNLDFLIDERARELYFEGHRRTDLIRFNKYTKNYKWSWKNGIYAGTTSISDIYKIFPIPAQERAVNKNLKQNEGY